MIFAMFMILLKFSLQNLFRDQKKRYTDSSVNLFRSLIEFSRRILIKGQKSLFKTKFLLKDDLFSNSVNLFRSVIKFSRRILIKGQKSLS